MYLFHALLAVVLAVSVMTSQGAPTMRVVDLTHPIDARTLFWPGQPPYNFTVLFRGIMPAWKTWLEYNYFALPEHGGTHIDSPSHYVQGRWRTHQIPASRLVGPGVVIDVTDKVLANADYAATIDDIKEWEEVYGRIPDGAMVLLRTGWGRRYPDPKLTYNSRTPLDARTFHYPGIHEDTATWLVRERNLAAVGSDTPSPEPGVNVGRWPVHKTLLGRDIIMLEHLANLELLPVNGTTIVVGVVNLVDGSGGPARVMALLGADSLYNGSVTLGVSGSLMLSLLLAALFFNNQ